MSEQLESAPESFTDEDGDTFTVAGHGYWMPLITLSVAVDGEDTPRTIDFRKSDATKIIALIAEAAK